MATIKSYYANQNEYLYDLNKGNPYFDPTVYSEIGNDYLPLALLYKEKPSEKFSQQTYNYLTPQDKVNYIAVLLGLTDTKEYSQEEQLKSFDALSKQTYEQKQWDESNWFDKALKTTGSFLGNIVAEAWGVIEGLIDLGAGALQLVSGGTIDTREFIAKDLTRVSAMREDLAEFNKYNTFLQEGFGKWLYGAIGSISRLWTMFVPYVNVVGQAMYYGSLAGSSLEETYKTLGPESSFWEATLRAGLQTGAEWAGERLFGDLVFGKGLINFNGLKAKNALLHIGISMIGEGVEEVVTEGLNYIGSNFMTLINKDYSAFVTDTLGKDLLDAFMTGALMGGLITSASIPFARKIKLPNGTILTKNQSLLFKTGLLSDELKKVSMEESELFKLKKKSKDGVLDTNSVEYAKALEKDNKRVNNVYKAAKTLGVIKDFLGEAEYNKAEQRTLEQLKEAQTSIRNYYLEFSIGTEAYKKLTEDVDKKSKTFSDIFNKNNDTYKVTPVNVNTDEIRTLRTLFIGTGKIVIPVKMGGKNGELHEGFIADPNSPAVFVDVDKLDSLSMNKIYLGVIKTGIVETFVKNPNMIGDPEIQKLFPKKKGESYTEAEKYEIASKLLSDFPTIQDVVGTTKNFVGKIYSWIKNRIKISANKDTKNNLYKSLNKYFKALAIKAGTRDGCFKLAARYNIDPTELLNEFNNLTADCFQQHFASFNITHGVDANSKELGINFLQSGRLLGYRNEISEFKDFLNRDMYKKEFVKSILKNSEYANFAYALNTYLVNNYGFYINPNSNTFETLINLFKEIDADFRADVDEFVDNLIDLRESKDLNKAKKLVNDLNSKNYSIQTFFNKGFLSRIQLNENTKISFIYDESTSFTNAIYNPASNEGIKIYINPNDYFYTSKTSEDISKELYHSLIHESVHAIFNAQKGYLGTNIDELYRYYNDPANEKVKNKMVNILKQKGLDINPNLLAELTYMMTFGEYEAMRYGKPINKDYAKFMEELGYTADFGTALVSDGFIADNGKLSGIGIFKGINIGIESKIMTEKSDDFDDVRDIAADTESLSPEESLIKAEELEALKVEFNDAKNKLLEDETENNVDEFVSILKDLDSREDLSREDMNKIISDTAKLIKSLENKTFKNKIIYYLVRNNIELFPNITQDKLSKMEVIYAKSEKTKQINNIDDLKKSLEERIKEVVAKGDDAEIGELKHEIFENNGVLRSKFKEKYSREDLKQLDDLKKLFPKGKGFTTAELQRNIAEAIKSINKSKEILFEIDNKYVNKYNDQINIILEKENKDLTYSQLYDKYNSLIKIRDEMTLAKKEERKNNIVKEKVKKINSKKTQAPEEKTIEILEDFKGNETIDAVIIESKLINSAKNASETIKNKAKEISDFLLSQDSLFELKDSTTQKSNQKYWSGKDKLWRNQNEGYLKSLESDFDKSPELYKLLEENIKNSDKEYRMSLLNLVNSVINNNMTFSNVEMIHIQENIRNSISSAGSTLSAQAHSLGLEGSVSVVVREMSEKYDGYKFEVTDKTAIKYIPELENREAYVIDLKKEKAEIEKKLKSKDSEDVISQYDISILGQRLLEIDKTIDAVEKGNNKVLLDLLAIKLYEAYDFNKLEQLKTDVALDLAEQSIGLIEGGQKFKIIKLKDDGKFHKLSKKSREIIQTAVKNLESFRYLSMLSSPVTFFNNALNNSLMAGLDHITNALEKTYGKKVKWREGQLKYTDTINDDVRKFVNKIFPKDTKFSLGYSTTARKMMMGDKYNLSSDNKIDIGEIESKVISKSSKVPIFYKFMNAWRKWVDWGVSKGPLGDTPFTARHLILEMERMLSANLDYIRTETIKAYSTRVGLLKADEKALIKKLKESKSEKSKIVLKGLNGDVASLLEIAPNETFTRILELAKEKANETFFRNSNVLSKWVFNLKKTHPILGHLLSIPVPFIGVGYNIFKTAMHYSPLELLNTASLLLEDRAVKKYNGELSLKQQTVQARLVESYARATVGTTLTFIGIILALAGLIKIDDDDYMGVCLKIGDLKIRLSDLSASTYALSTGAAIIYASSNDRNRMNDAFNVLYDTTLFGTIENLFKYSSSPTNYIENQSIAYVNQYVPAFLKLITKVIDPTIKAKTGGYFDRLWKNIASGLPIMSYAVGSRIDPYTGETYSRYGRFFDYFNIISPLKMASTKKTPLELEAKRLGTTTTFTSGKYKINGKSYTISGKQLEDLSVFKGKFVNSEYSKLVSSGKWGKMSDDDKKKALEYIYSKATEIMKIEYWTNDLKNVYITKTIDEYNRIKPYITNKLKIKFSKSYRGSKYKES